MNKRGNRNEESGEKKLRMLRMLTRNMKANVMRNATKQNKKNYFIVFEYYRV